MKTPLLTLIALLAFNIILAQNFSFDPATSIEAELVMEEYQISQIDIFNETTGTLELAWRLIEDNMPEGWTYSLCDNTACYGTIPPSALMNPIAGDEYAFLKTDVNPHDIPGEGNLVLHVHEVGTPADFVEVVFNFYTLIPTNRFEIEKQKLKIYPNPVAAFLQLDNPSGNTLPIILTDMLGRKMLEVEVAANTQKTLNTSAFPSGMYLLNYPGTAKMVSRKIKIQH